MEPIIVHMLFDEMPVQLLSIRELFHSLFISQVERNRLKPLSDAFQLYYELLWRVFFVNLR
uniref:Uncharacterized protein n=1 Tax=Cucumis melo TaxID=3656 RepID=A0A9I9EMA1_CUCME